MMRNKGMLVGLICSIILVALMCLINNVGGMTFIVIVLLIMCAVFNYFSGIRQINSTIEKKYKGYEPKEIDDMYFDTRLKMLRKKVVNKELSETQYKRERDKLTKEFNEGKIYDRKDES